MDEKTKPKPKYSKHWPYTVAHTIDCVCSKMLNHALNNVPGVNIVFESREVPPGLVFSKFDLFWLSFT